MGVIVFGADGMLGSCVVRELLQREIPTVAILHKERDIGSLSQLASLKYVADTVINCAGVIEGPATQMILANALGPHNIQEECNGIRHLVHVSTDCVFSGKIQGRWLTKDDLPDPVSLYGRSKLAGEIDGKNVTTVRCSFIGPNHGFLRWLLDKNHSVVNGWSWAYWNGSTVWEVAKNLVDIAIGEPRGLTYLATNEIYSKYDLAVDIIRALHLDIGVHAVYEPAINRRLKPDIVMKGCVDSLKENTSRIKVAV
jgi:dTDP-4-dehydrorhamnose reductase